MKREKSFTALDTNILVYAFDRSESKKWKACRRLFQDIIEGKKQGVVTNQILGELSYVLTTKVRNVLPQADVAAIVGTILTSSNWHVLNYTGDTVLKSLDSPLSFWDSLIAQTLKEHGVATLLTENVKDFQGCGIKVVSPF
jgi:predicted nucleic acid-binding protein